MRLASVVIALAAGLLPLADARAATATTPAAVAAKAPAGDTADAAARHAKRGACLREARVKKVPGAQRKDFLAACNAAPASPPPR